MKQKVINVEYRKDSTTFPDWMKYEVTILNEDGTTQKIPAYGKDLQDALSRVVHDRRVGNMKKKTEKISTNVWLGIWFGYLAILISAYMKTGNFWIYVGGLISIPVFVLALNLWSRNKNRDMEGRKS